MSDDKGKRFLVYARSSGFIPQTSAQDYDKKTEAFEQLKKAREDFKENKWSHNIEPTLYIRVDQDLLAALGVLLEE